MQSHLSSDAISEHHDQAVAALAGAHGAEHGRQVAHAARVGSNAASRQVQVRELDPDPAGAPDPFEPGDAS